MRTAAWERAPQMALRGCSKEAGDGKVEIYVILVRGELMQESMYFSLFFLEEVSSLGE